MALSFQELDRRSTAMGELSLRRRRDPTVQIDVFEVQLGGEFLMSSLFTAAEIELARLALAALPSAAHELDVAVGGLGLGYTALAALEDDRVRSVYVIDALAEVIDWHTRGLLPLTAAVSSDPRCRLVCGDFFALMAGDERVASDAPERFHAILVDIDHTPSHLLHPSHAAFYTSEGLTQLTQHLHPEGVFALWSDAPPDPVFVAVARAVFGSCESHVVAFPNPYTDGESTNTVYVATGPSR